MRFAVRVLALGLLWASAGGIAGTFAPNDRLVSDPAIDLKDPEFDGAHNLMVWQDLDGNLWQASIDPASGAIVPETGMGQLIDTGLASVVGTGNGPEFGYGNGRTFLCYTKLIQGTKVLAVAFRGAGGGWAVSPLANGRKRWRPVCTPADTQDAGRLVYIHETAPGMRTLSWRTVTDPGSERSAAGLGETGGRWAPGGRAFIAPVEVDGVKQIVWMDIETGIPEQITFGAEDKINPFLWYAPEYRETLMSAVVNLNSVGIFRRIDGIWTEVYRFRLPSALKYVSSPEPFVHNERSFIAVIAAQALGKDPLPQRPVGAGEVWIANIDPQHPFFRRIDAGTNGPRRAEPEPLVLSSGPVVYYTETDDVTGNALLRVADTGLGSIAAGDSDSDGVSDDRDNCITRPNPDQRDTDSDGIGNACDGDLNNDCIVNRVDLEIMKSLLGTTNPHADMNGDGTVSLQDLSTLITFLGKPPGPSYTPHLCTAR